MPALRSPARNVVTAERRAAAAVEYAGGGGHGESLPSPFAVAAPGAIAANGDVMWKGRYPSAPMAATLAASPPPPRSLSADLGLRWRTTWHHHHHHHHHRQFGEKKEETTVRSRRLAFNPPNSRHTPAHQHHMQHLLGFQPEPHTQAGWWTGELFQG